MNRGLSENRIHPGMLSVWWAQVILTVLLTAAFFGLCRNRPGPVTVMHISGELFSMFLISGLSGSLFRACSAGSTACRHFYRVMMVLEPVMAADVVLWLRYGSAAEGAELWMTLWYLVPMAILAFAYTGLFLKSVAEEKELRENARRFMSAGVAEELAGDRGGDPYGTVEEKPDEAGEEHGAVSMEAAVLFCHIHDFSGCMRGQTEETSLRALRYFFGEVSEIIKKHGGTVLSFPGHCVLCMFGKAPSLADAARAAVETGLEISREMENFGALEYQTGLPPLPTGIGVHAGTMYVGSFGNEEQKRYTVIGKTVNEASRIENHTKDGEVLVSDAVKQMLAGRFRFEEAGMIYPKGIDAGVTVWKVSERQVQT